MADAKSYAVMIFKLFSLVVSICLLPIPLGNAGSSGYPAPDDPAAGICNYTSIYQLGDSYSDTGNLVRESPTGSHSAFARLPYGQSLFKHPTGRCSNGLLMIDFIAKDLGIPPLNPYLNKDAIFNNGVNFAIAGATALPTESLAAKSIGNPITNSSLSVQLDWMWSYFNSICYDDQDCSEKLEGSLFIVGEIGSHDYYYALLQGKTIGDVNSMVLDVVQAIVEGVERVIQIGASNVIVPGIFPLGCFPAYLSAFRANDTATYDEYRCLNVLNDLSMYHNTQLQQVLQELRQDHQNITIIYGDYYNAFRRLLRNAPRFRFNASITSDLKKACCGIGERYNFNPTRMCGAQGVPVCSDPDSYIIWDGLNLTQQAYRLLARFVLRSTTSCIRHPN